MYHQDRRGAIDRMMTGGEKGERMRSKREKRQEWVGGWRGYGVWWNLLRWDSASHWWTMTSVTSCWSRTNGTRGHPGEIKPGIGGSMKVLPKKKERQPQEKSTKLFGNSDQLLKEPGMCENKKVLAKTKELLKRVTFRKLEGPEWTTDPAPSISHIKKLKNSEGVIRKMRLSNIKHWDNYKKCKESLKGSYFRKFPCTVMRRMETNKEEKATKTQRKRRKLTKSLGGSQKSQGLMKKGQK